MPLGLGFHAKSAFFLNIFCRDLKFFSGDLPQYWSDSWRRYSLKGVCWCVDGDMASQFGLGVSSEQSGKEKYNRVTNTLKCVFTEKRLYLNLLVTN